MRLDKALKALSELCHSRDDREALSCIERHVQEMEQIALSASLVGVVCPECGTDDNTYWRGGMTSSWECPCVGVIFTPEHPALPAREKGEE